MLFKYYLIVRMCSQVIIFICNRLEIFSGNAAPPFNSLQRLLISPLASPPKTAYQLCVQVHHGACTQ